MAELERKGSPWPPSGVTMSEEVRVEASAAIKAIETTYAGCRFRSRLEARWAVFFDALQIPWQYEAQGYVVDGRPYLPDFDLPSNNYGESFLVEVKGSSDRLDTALIAATALELDRNVLILGPVPKPGSAAGFLHWIAHPHLGEVFWRQGFWMGFRDSQDDTRHWKPLPVGWDRLKVPSPERLLGETCWFVITPEPVLSAYRAGLSARFEHGETP